MLLIEDQELLLDTIKNAFDKDDNLHVEACLKDISFAMDILKTHPNIDILFSDICTGNNNNAFDYIEEIKKNFPKLKIILVTAFPELSFVEKAKQMKVESFTYKNIPMDDLLSIIKNTYRGYSIYPANNYNEAVIFKELNDREIEILRLYCRGYDRKEIADKLFLSESTIKNYISDILLKTEYDSMAKLALYAVKNGFIV